MTEFPHITRNPDVSEGRPCVSDSRVTVSTILGLLAVGHSQPQILALYRGLTAEDIREALLYAARQMQEPEPSGSFAPHGAVAPAVQPLPAADAAPEAGILAATEPDRPESHVPVSVERLEFGPAGREPWVVVTRAGIWDRRMCADLIAWEDIHEIYLHRRDRPHSVCLELRTPDRYISRMPLIRRLRVRISMIFGIPPFCVSGANTGTSVRELYVRIKRIWIVYRADTALHSREIPPM
jgi:uncharacterized protein (DUF433 family)